MKIGIVISQIVYKDTGVAKYLQHLVQNLLELDRENEYVLFFSSMRKRIPHFAFASRGRQNSNKNVQFKTFRVPTTFLDFLWNKLHIMPIEWLIGNVDVFISSDWTKPPTKKAKKATILYDLIVFTNPEETAKKIIEVQKRKLAWVKKESDTIFCISEATKKDAMNLLGIEEKKLQVLYPGI